MSAPYRKLTQQGFSTVTARSVYSSSSGFFIGSVVTPACSSTSIPSQPLGQTRTFASEIRLQTNLGGKSLGNSTKNLQETVLESDLDQDQSVMARTKERLAEFSSDFKDGVMYIKRSFGNAAVVCAFGWVLFSTVTGVLYYRKKTGYLERYKEVIYELEKQGRIEGGEYEFDAHRNFLLFRKNLAVLIENGTQNIISLEISCKDGKKLYVTVTEDLDDAEDYNDLDEERVEIMTEERTWGFYLEHPWELKLYFQRSFNKTWKRIFGSSKVEDSSEVEDDEEDETGGDGTVFGTGSCSSDQITGETKKPRYQIESAFLFKLNKSSWSDKLSPAKWTLSITDSEKTEETQDALRTRRHEDFSPDDGDVQDFERGKLVMLKGDPRSHTHFDKLCFPHILKDRYKDRKALSRITGVAVVFCFGLLARRATKALRRKKTLAFARNHIRNTTLVKNLSQGEAVAIDFKSGVCNRNFIDGEFKVLAKKWEVTVFFTGVKSKASDSWRVLKNETQILPR